MQTTTRPRIGERLDLRRVPPILGAAVLAAYFGVSILHPGFPGKFAFVDPVILALCAYSIASMMYRGSTATSGALRLLPWVWLILLGSFLGLAGVGIPAWAMTNLSRSMFAILTFVCLWHLLIVARLQRMAIYGTALGVAMTTGYLLSQSSKYRASALFLHPNYAGHFMVMGCMVLFVVAKRWYFKGLAVFAVLVALQQTSSFGAMAMLVAMLGVFAVRLLARNTAILAVALAVLAIGGLFMTTPQAQDLVSNEDSSWTFSDSISGDRFERSGDTRLILWAQALDAWAQEPLGIGPDGVRSRGVAVYRGTKLEIHSDAIGYLVERGIIGLVGFFGFWITLILLAKKGGLARVLIAGVLVQGLFRETMHYRHMWLLLALAFAIDYARPPPSEDDDETEALEPVEVGARSGGGTADYFPGVARWPKPT